MHGAHLKLPEAGVTDLWPFDLRHRTTTDERLLGPEERARADSFRFPRDRDRFVVRRSRLRTVLARYLGTDPAALKFATDANGKPRLLGAPAELDFSLSDSGDAGALAVVAGTSVGLDIELHRTLPDAAALAERCLTARERAAWQALPPAARPEALMTCWTRKEAVMKAAGLGLALDPAAIETGLEGAGWASVLPPDAPPWWVESFSLVPEAAASIAAPRPLRRRVYSAETRAGWVSPS